VCSIMTGMLYFNKRSILQVYSILLLVYAELAKLCDGIFISSVKHLEPTRMLCQWVFVDSVRPCLLWYFNKYVMSCFNVIFPQVTAGQALYPKYTV